MKKNINIKEFHLKYIYQKFKKKIFSNNAEDIFTYCNNNNEIGLFCRDLTRKILKDSENII